MAAKRVAANVAQSSVGPVTCEVKYHGFIHVSGKPGVPPGLDKVKEAYQLLRKPKAARDVHPLFARGFETNLMMRVTEAGLKVMVPTPEGSHIIVMDHPIHKIAYVVDMGTFVLFIAKRQFHSSDVMFKCHGFECKSGKTAKQLASHIALTCNSVFRKLRRTRKALRRTTQRAPPEQSELEKDMARITLEAQANAAKEAEKEAQLKADADKLRQDLLGEVDAAKKMQASLRDMLKQLEAEEDQEEDSLQHEYLQMGSIYFDDYDDEFARLSLVLQPQHIEYLLNLENEEKSDYQPIGEEEGEYAMVLGAEHLDAPTLESDQFMVTVTEL